MAVRTDGRSLDIGPLQRQLVLAVLLAAGGRPVPVETLIDRVWDQQPPAGARNGLYAHLTRIRGVLREVSAAARTPVALVRGPCGYLMDLDPEWVDLHRFHRLLSVAGGTDNPDERRRLLRAALDLIDGVPLAGLGGEWAAGVRQGLHAQRLQALLDWGRAELAGGSADLVITELAVSGLDFPLAEPLIALHMRALHASGRSAEALACYAQARERLVEELGTDPGPELAEVHGTILRGPARPPVPTRTAMAHRARPRPAQPPGDVSAFTGRHAELAWLDTALGADPLTRDPPGAPAIGLICGTPGAGKTALALRWAHRVSARFPDGQLFTDLRGYDPHAPAAPADVLAGFLRALGVSGAGIPCDVDERAAAYRSLLANRRVLVVLDNAGTAEQVRLLLPGSPGCATLVSSRDRLGGLVARHGARRLDLELLPEADAAALMWSLIGERALAEPHALARLIGQCAYLPLALRVAAELAVARGDASLGDLAAELADEERRLALLDAGQDQRTGLEAVFSWSYRQLPPVAARAFRLLGLHPGPDWTPPAVAALTGADLPVARTALDTLAQAHLVQATTAGRFAMHDLLRAYARGLTRAEETQADRHAALAGLLDHSIAATANVVPLTLPRSRPKRAMPVTHVPLPEAANATEARAWLDAERRVLIALITHAADHGHPAAAVQLAELLWDYLDNGGYPSDALAVHTVALRAARAEADLVGQAHALLARGIVLDRWGRHDEAAEHMREASRLAHEVGAIEIEARSLHNLALNVGWSGRQTQEPVRLLQRALLLWQRTEDRATELRTLVVLGMVESELGRHDAAVARLRRALELARLTGNRRGEAEALDSLGHALEQAGHPEEALKRLRGALPIWRDLGATEHEMISVLNLATTYWRVGRPRESLAALRRVLKHFGDRGNLDAIVRIRNNIGHASRVAGHPSWALDLHQRAFTEAVRIDSVVEQSIALDGAARALRDLGRPAEARQYWTRALGLHDGVEHYLVGTIREQLATLDEHRSNKTTSDPRNSHATS